MTTELKIGPEHLSCDFDVPLRATGVVLFAHGSGSGRHSPRNQRVAELLHEAGMATLLLDLLTSAEEQTDQFTRHYRFDVPLLAQRLIGATDWIRSLSETKQLPLAYFGASTGAAAALVAAADRPDAVQAVVSRGGRPDLAGRSLLRVKAHTLLIVGANDRPVIALNREAFSDLRCEKKFVLVPRATHLFEEPGTLDEVARLARDWFITHLR
jgi:pimeloyl-ACP methyl ester carboxylesterase